MARREGLEPSTSGFVNRRSDPAELTSHEWCTHLGLNQGLPLCKSGALPLSYACASGGESGIGLTSHGRRRAFAPANAIEHRSDDFREPTSDSLAPAV